MVTSKYPWYLWYFPLVIINESRDVTLDTRRNIITINTIVFSNNLNSKGSEYEEIIKEAPNPTRILNKGPAKQAARAACDNPILATATLAVRSPIEFPQARRVIPSNEELILKIIPKSSIVSIIIEHIEQIHTIDITKADRTKSML